MEKKQKEAREIVCWLVKNDIEVPEKLREMGTDMDFINEVVGKEIKEECDNLIIEEV